MQRLEKQTGRKVRAKVEVDKELIGGVRVVLGDKVIDGSVRAQLGALESRTEGIEADARSLMQLNPSEICELIKSRIQNLDAGAQMRTAGHRGLGDRRHLPHPRPVRRDAGRDARVSRSNTFGLALNLERDSVGAVILGEYEHITEGDTVKSTGRSWRCRSARSCSAAW